MKIYYCGFNGFEQWPSDNSVVKEFTVLDSSKLCEDFPFKSCAIGWPRVIFQFGSKFFISGFFNGEPKTFREVQHPSKIIFDGVSLGDEYALFYDSNEIWKFRLDGRDPERWRRVLSVSDEEESAKSTKSSIIKTICGTVINVALLSDGRLFNLPSELKMDKKYGKVIDVHCGHEHCIALTEVGNVLTWGSGSRCQLGNGNIESCERPELVEALAGIKIMKIAAGGWHCCAVSQCGDLYVWGWNDFGQLGIKCDAEETSSKEKKIKLTEPPSKNYPFPTLVNFYIDDDEKLELNVADVSCGSKHTLAVLEDGSVWGTGNNKYSQLGFDSEMFEKLWCFKKIDLLVCNPRVFCGSWNSVIFSDE